MRSEKNHHVRHRGPWYFLFLVWFERQRMYANTDKSELYVLRTANCSMRKKYTWTTCIPSTSSQYMVSWNKNSSLQKFSLESNCLSAHMILLLTGFWFWDLSFCNGQNKQRRLIVRISFLSAIYCLSQLCLWLCLSFAFEPEPFRLGAKGIISACNIWGPFISVL